MLGTQNEMTGKLSYSKFNGLLALSLVTHLETQMEREVLIQHEPI